MEEKVLEYVSKNNEIIFETGFICAWNLFFQCNKNNGILGKMDEEMNEKLLHIFEMYKNTSYYNNSSKEVNIDWLKDKISESDFSELKSQIYAILNENEEEIFVNCSRFMWGLFHELSDQIE